MKILVIAPHPDDETIGAGGAIARHIAMGDEVSWCIVTRAYSPPWPDDPENKCGKQIAAVQNFFGINSVHRLDFPTVTLNNIPHIDLCTALQKIIYKIKPHIVYTTSRNDINLDHRIVYDCTLVATRPLPGNTVRRVLSYEISYTKYYGMPSGSSMFQPNVFIDISSYLEIKLKAMSFYETELHQLPHPRCIDGLRLLAHERGLCTGFTAAECFELVRELI